MTGVNVFKNFAYLEDPLLAREKMKRIIRELSTAKKNLRIYTGDAYWCIFDYPDLLRILRECGKNGVSIKMVAGPALSIGGSPKSPEITDLVKDGLIEFYYRSRRGAFPDFFIRDNCVLADKENYNVIPRLHLWQTVKICNYDFPEEFKKYSDKFDEEVEKADFTNDLREKCLLLRVNEMHEAFKMASRLGIDYNYLTRSEIEIFVKMFRERKDQIKKEFNEALGRFSKK